MSKIRYQNIIAKVNEEFCLALSKDNFKRQIADLLDVKKVVICIDNTKVPLTVGKDYNVYLCGLNGYNTSLPELYYIIPDDKFERTKFLRIIKRLFFIPDVEPQFISSVHFKDADKQYLRDKLLKQLLNENNT